MPGSAFGQLNYITNFDGTLTITGYTGTNGNLDIPYSINGAQVSVVSSNAFFGNLTVTNVTIEIESYYNYPTNTFGAAAFENCSNLSSVFFSDGSYVSHFPNSLFQNCINLTNVGFDYGYGLQSIGTNAFYNCQSLPAIAIIDGITNVSPGAFEFCTNLSGVYVSSNLQTMGASVFYGCVSLTNITLPDTLRIMGNSNFYGCIQLQSVSFLATNPFETNALLSIPTSAFQNCTNLVYMEFPTNVTSIQSAAFSGCKNLADFVLPPRLGTIGANAFSNCTSLTTVYFPSNETSISISAFSCCSNLVSVYFPSNLTTIAPFVFYSCTSLSNIVFDSRLITINTSDFANCTSLTSVTLPTNLTTLAASAFAGCTSLSNLVIGSRLTSLGSNVFANCKSLISVTLPANLTTIGPSAFTGCTSLTNVIFPTNLTAIDADAFQNCTSLATLSFPVQISGPGRLKFIGNQAFSGCTALTNVFIPGSVTNLVVPVFGGCSQMTAINVSATNAFYSSVGGVVFSTNLMTLYEYPAGLSGSYSIPYNVTNLASGSFEDCPGLTGITIPPGAVLGTNVFAACSNLVSVTFLGDVSNNIPNYTFQNCVNLAGITLPNTITNIGTGAFAGCTSLSDFIIPTNVATMGSSVFANCPGISVYFLGNEPISIGATFAGLSYTNFVGYLVGSTGWGSTFGGIVVHPISLPGFTYTVSNLTVSITGYVGTNTSVIVPDQLLNLPVAGIGPDAFANATFVTNISITPNVTSIGDAAFANTGIQSLSLSANVTSIGQQAFLQCTSLTNISVDPANSDFSSSNGVLFDISQSDLIQFPAGLAENYIIPSTVTNIGDYSFAYSGITGVTIPSSVVRIGTNAFYGCFNLADIAVPASVTNICDQAFAFCTSLTNIMVDPASVVYSSTNGALLDQAQTTLIQFPAGLTSLPVFVGVTSVGPSALAGCVNLTIINIPDGIKIVGDPVFDGCTNLTTVIIPASVTTIGLDAFADCTRLTNIIVDAANLNFSSLNGVLFDKNQATLIQFPGGLSGFYAVPKSVTTIGDDAFNACYLVTGISIGNGVTNIGTAAFAYCGNLTNINVSPLNQYYSSVAGVLFDSAQFNLIAFPGGLTGSYTVPAGVTNIWNEAFAGCNLTTVFLDANLAGLGDSAFADSPALKTVYFLGTAPQVDYGTAFDGENNSVTVFYYPGTSGWSSGTFGGAATTAWILLTQDNAVNAGTYGFTIIGEPKANIVVEACNDLTSQVWVPVSTNSLDSNGYSSFNDPQSSALPSRFYRLRTR